MNITSIIFDGSGVITDEQPRKTARMWSEKYNIPYNDIWQTVYKDNYNLARDGILDAKEYYKKSVNTLGVKISYEEFVHDYIADCAVRPEMITILQALSKKVPLYLFSNQTEINTIYLRPLLEQYFKHIIFSNEVRMHKPDKNIYELLLKHIGTNKESALYIDDRSEQLEAAKKYGISTYLFLSVSKLKDHLSKRSLL
ncbi:hypothetical protein A2334_04495 [Candidatus Roizmanbacteria bacterium RIFOXYB2_FULL_38_10]|uniref:HAD family hydrolase n=1 Tax=Candidatus Roizmanbacteria bacterium RIFOXYD1_FULL_38_12 TaxID=1802093 RepID=A0A1F7KZI0_9BACT|nr:MAG: hypothetical protein A3K47_00600 [Candidatus Roizmanbacteria bacterium RIFOXYA2_FULL_38_14]OGK63290.1 MAG: hypothetical protein A3K27_00600 [Candidatus Roizmanbacteria bacterium RIFOXYA1_FULL_37_12]OGK65136.1 MAG: hypothetical protein A3K38_00600 [Candidatus Roizmanbacteria bacterium RIFOXYB1_FULL_40_23]OGK68691.1 MAG: hypothetical protein A2334_04495 [Candidatus Roizmanbacteria bacterium RIFOXYB2_FULL_38_10]OGK69540.1 MAG: hypothetical protein A3K21_00600 [Candidatus Roizmanbacteria ba